MSEFENIPRIQVPEMDEILGKPLKVLDDGFVRVVDYMGTDQSIVQSARISYGSGTKKVRQDRGLIRYLMRHWHTTPFEMCEIKLHVRVPMDCWRQWIRHRTANVNEYSTRYSVAIDAAQTTLPGEWRFQSASNRQGSEDFLSEEEGARFTAQEKELQDLARKVYNERVEAGIAREQARKDLPLSTYTEAYWKVDLHNLLHFLRLRMDEHAQWEIREFARTIGEEIVSRWCPIAWEAFMDYRFNSMALTSLDVELIRQIAQGENEEAVAFAKEHRWLYEKDGVWKKSRECKELEGKLVKLGMKAPW